MSKQQVLIFLQLAECLVKQLTVSPSTTCVKVNYSILKSLHLYEDSEILRCTLAIIFNRDSVVRERADQSKSNRVMTSVDN